MHLVIKCLPTVLSLNLFLVMSKYPLLKWFSLRYVRYFHWLNHFLAVGGTFLHEHSQKIPLYFFNSSISSLSSVESFLNDLISNEVTIVSTFILIFCDFFVCYVVF